jgi:Tfp pilus assembly PilM family ATPase
MAQRILGVDLGAYSVKIAELDVGFRQSKLRLVRESRLLPALEGEAPIARAARTLRAMLDVLDRQPDSVALALGADATLRVIDMPFQDARKIDQVIGYELESQILGDLDGLVVDQVIAETQGEGARVLAIGADRKALSEAIGALAAVRAEPRHVGAAVLCYAPLAERSMPPRAISDELVAPRPVDVIVDIGHRCTRVAVVENGRTLFARVIQRGGADVTAALMEAYRLDEDAAERAKHAQAVLLPDPRNATDPQRRKLDQILRDSLRPLVRELKQTLAASRAQGAPSPTRLGLLGGTARLSGLSLMLEQELSMPVVRLALPLDMTPSEAGGEVEGPGLPGVALGMTMAAAQGGDTQVNLRKGDLSFRNDYAFLRGKARSVGIAVMAILAFTAVNAVASLRALRKESDVLEAKLKKETIELFGVAKLDGKAVSEELRRGPQSGMPPVPALTAYDVLDEISRHLPPRDAVKLDILELDIKPKKTYLKATAASAKEIDTLVEALKQIDCFGEIQKGKTASVSAPAGGDSKEKVELKQFTLTIETTCP